MKKLLICLLIMLICVATIMTAWKGLHIGNFVILGIEEIKREDTKLDEKLQDATKLVSTEYPNKVTTINADVKAMKAEKQTYEDMVAVSTQSEIASAIQRQKYTVDKLWAKLGTLATDEGLDAKFELKNGTLTSSNSDNFTYYNIKFTVTGTYTGIALYISSLEDDSELNFKIEDFSMMPTEDGSIVTSTFITKDIAIEGISSNVDTTTQSETDMNTNNTTTNNTTNTSILNNINSTMQTNKTNTTNSTNNTANNSKTTDTIGNSDW